MSSGFLIAAAVAIAVFIIGFAVVGRLFIGRLKGEDVEAEAEGRRPGHRPDGGKPKAH